MALKALIVDDMKMTLIILEQVLKKQGFIIDKALDGEKALELAKDNNYDLIITDIIMPKIEGIEVINELVEMHPNTKIIAMTAEGQAGYTDFLTLATTVGANAALKKPFSSEDLLSAIEKTGLFSSNDTEEQEKFN